VSSATAWRFVSVGIGVVVATSWVRKTAARAVRDTRPP
jgi:hypothetical protein